MARRKVFNGGKARELREERNQSLDQLTDTINKISAARAAARQVEPTTWDKNTINGGELGRPVGLHLQHAWAAALGVDRSVLLMDAPEQEAS